MLLRLVGCGLALVATQATAAITDVTCYTGGDSAGVSLRDTFVLTSVMDLPSGGYAITGRKVKVGLRANAALTQCRSWYIHQTSYTDDTYRYSRRERQWNSIVVEPAAAVTRATCGVGSVLTEYDSTDAYVQVVQQKYVERRAPAAGSDTSSYGYVSGEDTVSLADCIDFNLP